MYNTLHTYASKPYKIKKKRILNNTNKLIDPFPYRYIFEAYIHYLIDTHKFTNVYIQL